MTGESRKSTLLARVERIAHRLDAGLRGAVEWGERWSSLPAQQLLPTLFFLVLALVAFGYGVALFSLRVWFESMGPYSDDTTLYWTVGRGIVNGLMPYRDLYETKPPGIFLLSALSFLLTKGYGLTHVTQIGSLLFVALSPIVFVRRLFRSGPLALLVAPELISLWAIVLLLATFTADRGHAVQVETHGLAGAVGYVLLLGRRGRWAFFGRALGVAVCIGMKEPFFLLLPAVYLLTLPKVDRVWPDLLGPLLVTAAAGTLILICFGWFHAYTDIYLKTMLGAHVQLTGSPIGRATIGVNATWDDLHAYSGLLPATVLFCMGLYLFLPDESNGSPATELIGKRLQVLVVGLLLAGLAVGMGGTFFPHHYIFALPLVFAVLFVLMQRLPDVSSRQSWHRATFIGLTLATVCIPWVRPVAFRNRMAVITAQDVRARESALVIDGVLDRLKVERYLFIGPGGGLASPYTRHAPLGPLFFQQVMFFEGHYPKFVAQFRQRLEEAPIVVFRDHFTGPLDDEVKKKLAADFKALPAEYIPTGLHCQDKILVRKTFALP